MSKGYAEGPAAEEAERRREELEAGVLPEPEPTYRRAVWGATADNPEKHFLGWLGDVDPDRLFDAGEAWGITIVRETGRAG